MASSPLDEIRRLYFTTKKTSILDDFDRAIDLLKLMESPDERAKATVYMSGLADMRKEWGKLKPARTGALRPRKKP